MAVHEILKMGDPRLLEPSRPVRKFRTDELNNLIADMRDTMKSLNGAGLAAPQIGVNLQVVIFGVEKNPRYPDAEEVPFTILVNPKLTPVGDDIEEGWEGCLSVPGMRGLVPRFLKLRYQGFDETGKKIDRTVSDFLRAWCSTSAIIWQAFCTRCASATCATSGLRRSCFQTRR